MKRDPRVTRTFLRGVLHYDPKTGVFTWLVRRGRALAGTVAGTIGDNGYRFITVLGRRYTASNIAWLYIMGRWPDPYEVDHINRNRADDSFNNLRRATRSKNMANIKGRSSCGFKGAYLTPSGRYRSQVRCGSENRYLGMFDTPEEAHAAYVKASQKLFGSYARSQ